MNKSEAARLRSQNRKRRRILMWYGSKFFGLPYTFKFRKHAYEKLFGIRNPSYLGNNINLVREHRQLGNLIIGEGIVLSDNVVIDYTGEVQIGDGTHISSGVKIYSHNHDCYKMTHGNSTPTIETTKIGNNCWIGANAIILSGVTIGDRCVVGAGSIVTHDVPDDMLVAGNPARIIRCIEEEQNDNEQD